MERPHVRPATIDDVDAVAATVSAAFESDPGWTYILGRGNARGREAFARALLLPRLRKQTAWVTDDCTAVAMWDRRSIDGLTGEDHDAWWDGFNAEVGDYVCARLEVYEGAIESGFPGPPFWYLGVLATHPDHQGRGLASAVMRPGLAAADEEGWDCWLETSTPGNKAFYEGRGFTESVPIDLPGGPPTWCLRRPSATA